MSVPAAMEKIRDEMAANSSNAYVKVVGDFLLTHLDQDPQAAERVLADGKTIKGSLNAMKDEARKHQVDGCGVLTDEEGYAAVLKYFGIDAKPVPQAAAAPVRKASAFDVDLDDLLGKR